MQNDRLPLIIIGTILVLLVVRAVIAIIHRRQARARDARACDD